MKTPVISSNLFAPGRKFLNLVPRVSSTLRNFALDFSQLSDALRKRLNFNIHMRQDFKNYCDWVVIFILFYISFL